MRLPCLSVCLPVPHNFAQQRLAKHVLAAKNTHAAVEELLDAVFSVRSVWSNNLYVMKRKQAILFLP
jgi:hypothetical protein